MNKIDIHSHILYGIDDGSKTLETSLEIIKKMVNLGFEEIVLTPHYISYYHANNKIKKNILKEINSCLKKEKINVKLHLANEVRITSDILGLIKKDEISLLNNYIFLELPFNNRINNLKEIIYELQSNNINVIIVHPERYPYLEYSEYQELIDSDVELQVNYESITGKYGKEAKKRVKYLLKNNMVNYIATDVHRPTSKLFDNFKKIEKKITKIVGEEEYNNLTYYNMKKIIKKTKK